MMTKIEDAVSGVVFRYQDIFNWYSMEIYKKTIYFKKMKAGLIHELKKISMPDFSIGKWYDF